MSILTVKFNCHYCDQEITVTFDVDKEEHTYEFDCPKCRSFHIVETCFRVTDWHPERRFDEQPSDHWLLYRQPEEKWWWEE